MKHDGFSMIECLSECVEFYPGAFDTANPRKGGAFQPVPATHDVGNEVAAYQLADAAFPGYFGIFYQATAPTKNANEARIIANSRQKFPGLQDWQILEKSFEKMR